MSKEQSQGLVCPNCSGVVPVPEGARIVQCPYCQINALVQGERGVRRWQVSREVEREQVLQIVQGFFTGIKKAGDLKRKAQVRDVFLVYLPYWRVQATVAGWLFGRVKSGDDSTKPVEVDVLEDMHWNDAAVDVSEFGVHRVTLSKDDLLPYDDDQLRSEAMVFDPTESHSDALDEARSHFTFRGRQKRSLKQKFFEKFHFLREQLSIVYYPLWVVRYSYRQRSYQVVVDGKRGQILYGKAPGNIFYRAAALVAGMALGNLLLVDGTAVAGWIAANSSDDDSLGLVLVPLALGLGLIAMGYRAFRYGEEIEEIGAQHKKARLASGKGNSGFDALPDAMKSGDMSKLLQTGLSFVEEMAELKIK
ncbi:MAG: hypothetical protein H6664_15285 [Ardenticatenaceae bacterium]|nr:hypothetical protein [Ardenticatenaceae bacterium]